MIKQPHVSRVMINTSDMLLLTSNCDLWKCIILMYYIPRKKLDYFLGIFKFSRWLEVCFIGNTLEFGSESLSQIMPSFWMNKGLIFLKIQITDLRSSPVTNKHFPTLTLGPNTLPRPGFYLWEVFNVVTFQPVVLLAIWKIKVNNPKLYTQALGTGWQFIAL